MKAIIWTKYGAPDGLVLREIATPTPKEDELLIKVYAATAATPDTEFRRLKLPPLFAIPLRLYLGLIKPRRITILGTEFAGEIVATGKDVTHYQPGDQVYGYTGLGMSTYAQYLCLSEKRAQLAAVFAEKPANLTYAQAAALPFGGLEALHSLRRATIQPGQKVLIVGAGGTIGSYSVQLAKHYGAEVTGVDKAGKFEMLRSIGADHLIDYTKEDFTKNGQKYDVIMDTIRGSRFLATLGSLTDRGIYLNANPGPAGWLLTGWMLRGSHKRILRWTAGYSVKNLLALNELTEAGILKPVIDRRYPLEQIVEAHRYVESGHKKGNVVILVEHHNGRPEVEAGK